MRNRDYPLFLYDAIQARAIDEFAINELGLSGLALMQRAGQAAFDYLRAEWRNIKKISVVCGVGNNAGDGYVLASKLHDSGYEVTVVQVGKRTRMSADALSCYEAMEMTGLSPTHSFDSLLDADLVVDALFGIGITRQIEGEFAAAISRINEAARPIFSLDIPSGLNASSGEIFGQAVVATSTITFITAKLGLFTGAGPDYCGRVAIDDLDVPSVAYETVSPTAGLLQHKQTLTLLPARRRTGHKGTHGHTAIIGGAAGYRGALWLAGEAAARAGSGLVTLIGYADGAEPFNAERPELMYRAVTLPEEMRDLLSRVAAIAIGPGLGLGQAAMARFSMVLESSSPLVIDADALRLLAAEPTKRKNWVLTPHPGEAAILLNVRVSEVQSNRIAAAQEIVARYGGTVILKGAGSVVAADGMPEVLNHGNPGMGSGGMGDVLTGVVAGLIAQGLDCLSAARLGACIHAKAGDYAALEGERGLLARDLMLPIRRLVNQR